MQIPKWVRQSFISSSDFLIRYWPQPVPDISLLEQCKIVSHRGEYDNSKVKENTISAFEAVYKAGVWGLELDIRWTKNMVPVVIHDEDCRRVYNESVKISDIDVSELKKRIPEIPTLEEVIDRYGGEMHLMIELKKERYPNPKYQNQVLESLLKAYDACIDYHLISLHPVMFNYIQFTVPDVFLPVSEANYRQFSYLALNRPYGGITGHFMFLSNKYVLRHHRASQKVGTGFIDSKNCLFREINRGIDWIFTNKAIEMQRIIREILNQYVGNR